MIWITIRTEQEGDLWTAYCLELELASCGATEGEATANLKHAVIAFCRALDKRGLLEKRLEEKGVRFEHISPQPPKVGQQEISHGKLSPVLVA